MAEVISEPIVDTVVTSPPYWKQKDYGSDQQIGFGQEKEAYLDDLQRVLEESLAATKSTGSLWLVVDDYWKRGKLQLLPFDIADCARKAGWHLREMIVWDKNQALPFRNGKGRMRHSSELIFFATKTENTEFKFDINEIKTLDGLSKWWVDFPERYNPKGKAPTNIWSIPIRTQGSWRKPSKLKHHCPFPTELVARMIALATDPEDVVLDPFAGTGVVLAVSEAMNRRFIGFDVNADYKEMYEETVREQIMEEWEEVEQQRKKQREERVDFESTIMKLRALKFARQVTRPFLEVISAEEQERVRAVVCEADIPDRYVRREKYDVRVSVIVDDLCETFEEGIEKSKERATQPPLTQYSINPQISLLAEGDFDLSLNGQKKKSYFMYPRYKPRKYSKEKLLGEWFQNGEIKTHKTEGKVPLLANVGVDVEWALK